MLTRLNFTTGAGILIIGFILITLVFIIAKKIEEKPIKYLSIVSMFMLIINLYANSLSGAVQMHYFITFIPIMFVVVALILYAVKKMKNNGLVKILGISAVVLISILNYYNLTNKIIERYNSISFSQIVDKYILENSNETDKVQMIGGSGESTGANSRTKRLAPSRYNYLPLWDTFVQERKIEIVNEVVEDIIKEQPKIIMISNLANEEFNLLVENKEVWNNFLENNYKIFEEDIPLYIIYKLK